jgi:phosphoserine phosphatase RsbU/P
MISKEKLISMLDDELFDALGEAVLLIDKDYNVLYANASFTESFPENVSETKCYHMIGRESPCQICTCSLSSKKQLAQEKEETLAGRNYKVSSRIVPGTSFSSSFYVETYKDITYSKNLEESLMAKNYILKSNLDIAKQVQQSLLPSPLQTEKISFSYKYIPCDELGGDFFNLYQIDQNTYGVFMADVSGHGVSAAMLTMFLNASCKKDLRSPSAVLDQLYNEFNKNNFLKNQYIAIFYAVVDVEKKVMTYCNAGLNTFPILFNPGVGKFRLVESSGFPISNWVDEPHYSDSMITIDPDWRLLFYTDGITEAKNKLGIPYGTDRLIRSLMEGNPSIKITLDRMIFYLEDYIDENSSKLKDDVSLAILEIYHP